jgi:hypothetical protein
MAEHVLFMAGLVPNPLKLAHAGADIIFNGADPNARMETVIDPGKSLQDDAKFGKALVDGFVEPYKKSWAEGKYFEVAGRATFDIGSMFIGAGEANAAIKTGEVASVASKTAEVANVAGKTAEVANVASKTGEVANVASKSGKAAEVASTTGKTAEATNVASKTGKVSEATSATGKASEAANVTGKAEKAAEVASTTGKTTEVTSNASRTAKAAKSEAGAAKSSSTAKTGEEAATTGKGTTHGERTTNELAESARGKHEPTIREVEPVDFAPGYSRGLANRKMRRQMVTEAKKLGFDVEFVTEGPSYTIARAKKIVVNETTATPGTLLDEYAHAFNNVHGKGTYLPEELALKHRQLYDLVKERGSTSRLLKEDNYLYHQLELKNYRNYIKKTKGAELPGFIRAVPADEIGKFLEHTVSDTYVGLR